MTLFPVCLVCLQHCATVDKRLLGLGLSLCLIHAASYVCTTCIESMRYMICGSLIWPFSKHSQTFGLLAC